MPLLHLLRHLDRPWTGREMYPRHLLKLYSLLSGTSCEGLIGPRKAASAGTSVKQLAYSPAPVTPQLLTLCLLLFRQLQLQGNYPRQARRHQAEATETGSVHDGLNRYGCL